MKNKKIIPLTIAIVAVVLMGMLGLSKLFETSWQNEDQISNSLGTSPDIYQISDMGAFPFITMDEYLSINSNYNNLPQVIEVTDNMISYDESAVIGGTALEAICKGEDFRNLKFVIYPENREFKNKTGAIIKLNPIYTGFYEEKFVNSSRIKKSYYYQIDAITKEVISLRYTLTENFDKGMQTLIVENPVEYAKEIAYALGYKNLKAYFALTDDYVAYGKAHRVDFLIDENQSITIGFNSYDDTFLFMKNVAEISDYHENLIENGISLE